MKKISFCQQDLHFKLTDTSWQRIRKELKSYWRKPDYPYLEKYQPFADIFSNLNKLELAAFFYHVGYGQVPKEIFAQLQPNGWHTQVYGVKVHREVTVTESLWFTIITLGDKIVPVLIVIPIVFISLLLGSVGGFMYGKSPNPENDSQLTKDKSGSEKLSSVQADGGTSPESQVSTQNFNSTRKAIEKIVKELKLKDKSQDEIQTKIQDVLNQKNLSFEVINNDSNKLTADWMKAIKKYQEAKKRPTNTAISEVDGKITYDPRTIKLLKCDVAHSLTIDLKNDCNY